MKLSLFGQKFAGKSGIVELMDDLGSALNENPEMIFMGGGNPGRLPELEAVFQQRLEAIMADPAQRHSLFGIYQSPQGDREFRKQIAGFLKQQFGWNLSEHNMLSATAANPPSSLLHAAIAMPDEFPAERTCHRCRYMAMPTP
ncbi:MAG: hypothetical protein ACE37N_11945 [Pseudohongiellaceae bacterium]